VAGYLSFRYDVEGVNPISGFKIPVNISRWYINENLSPCLLYDIASDKSRKLIPRRHSFALIPETGT